jgi:HK97 family phage major capsid protein
VSTTAPITSTSCRNGISAGGSGNGWGGLIGFFSEDELCEWRLLEANYRATGNQAEADAIRTGKSTETFLAQVMDKISERHSTAQALEIGLVGKDLQTYSIMRAVQATLTGDWSRAGLERAASDAVAKRTGYTPEGFFVPVEAFSRAFSVGTAGEAGNLVGTQLLGNEFIDVLRNALVLSKLGIRVLGGLTSNIAIPRKTVASTIASYSEIGTITASNPTTAQITMSPKRVGGQVLYSKQALIQANPDVAMMLQDDLAQGVGVQIENLAINGTGASNQPRGANHHESQAGRWPGALQQAGADPGQPGRGNDAAGRPRARGRRADREPRHQRHRRHQMYF